MATPNESPNTAPTDTEQAEPLRAADATRDRVRQEWMMVATGLAGLMSILAVIVAAVALANPGTESIQAAPAVSASITPAHHTAAVAAPAAAEAVKLTIKTDAEHGKKGPDGKWHDAFLPANFTVHPGAKVTVTVLNYDNGPHSFTSPALSTGSLINVNLAAGSATAPKATTFTFTAPTKPGKYLWWCAQPCDPWAMAHIGYMRGYVTVAA